MYFLGPDFLRILVIILNFLFAIANFGLAFYIYKKGPVKPVNKTFAGLAGTNGLWCLTNFWAILAQNLLTFRLTYAIGSLIPLFGFFFSLALAEMRIKTFFKIALFILGLFFFVISFTPLVIKKIHSSDILNYQPELGEMFFAWSIYMITVVALSFIITGSALPGALPKRKQQIAYFFLGAGVFAFWAVTLAVILPLFSLSQTANLDSLGTIFLTGFTSYAIVKYQLMGIKSLFFYAFIISFVIIIVSLLIALLMFLGSWFFTNLGTGGVIIFAFLASILIVITAKSFFKKTRDLERTKINLTRALKKSEKDRLVAEKERNKTLAIINNFSDGLLIIGSDNKILLINPLAEIYLNIRAIDIVNKPISQLTNFPEARHLLPFLQERSEGVFKKEIKLRENLILEASWIPMSYMGKNLGNLIVLHNITRQKLIDKMKSDFISLVSHQLRGPMTAIKWGFHLFLNQELGRINKKQRATLEKIYKTNEKMIRLINDLLNIVQIEEGRYIPELKPSDIERVIKAVISSYKEKAKNKKVEILFEKSTRALPKLMLDKEKIKIAIGIILDNSIRYSSEGGKIIVNMLIKKEEVEIQVKDWGLGIPQSEQKKIFSKFFRGSNIIKRDTEGIGLGLFIAKNIIESHGGRIWFESKEGGGTTFHFALPIKK